VLWNHNDLLRFRFEKVSVPVPFPDHIYQFFKKQTKKFVQNLDFLMLEAAIFPRKLSFHFDSLTVYTVPFYVGSGTGTGPECITVPVPVQLRQKVTDPAVPVPFPQTLLHIG
jgi:hypothetical protein